MPLIGFEQSVYIRRDIELIDSDKRDINSKSVFDIIHRTRRSYQNIQSIEVTNFNISPGVSHTFYASTTTSPGNNLIDVYMHLPPNSSLEFTATIDPSIIFTTPSQLATYLETLLDDTMDAQATFPYLTSNSVNFQVFSIGQNFGNDFIYHLEVYAVQTLTVFETRFLFGSGPSKGNDAARPLGFDEGIDTLYKPNGFGQDPFPLGAIDTSLDGPTGTHPIELRPFRYVDLFIDQTKPSFGDSDPLARFFLNATDIKTYTSSRGAPEKTRLLTSPLRTIEYLNIFLRLEDNIEPSKVALSAWDVIIDILSIEQIQMKPGWITQRLCI